jgi:uncharacterized protein YqjF (DUF2071 family)
MKRRFLSASWRHLVMLNYEIDPAILRPLVPRGTELDAWQGRTFVSVVGFLFLDTRLLGLPVPFHRNFEEVNLRFYVRHQAAEGWRRGVAFIKEIVPRWAIAAVARWVYNENYVACPMRSCLRLPDPTAETGGAVEYGWRSQGRDHKVRATFMGAPQLPAPGSEEEFIAEHYWGYVAQRDRSTLEYGVEHPPWRVWRASSASLEGDMGRFYGPPYGEVLTRPPSSAFVAEGSPVVVFKGEGVPP